MNIFYCLEQVFGQSFKNMQNVFLCNESHFAVYLCKFRLTISARMSGPTVSASVSEQ